MARLSIFPREIFNAPRSWAEQLWSTSPTGTRNAN